MIMLFLDGLVGQCRILFVECRSSGCPESTRLSLIDCVKINLIKKNLTVIVASCQSDQKFGTNEVRHIPREGRWRATLVVTRSLFLPAPGNK